MTSRCWRGRRLKGLIFGLCVLLISYLPLSALISFNLTGAEMSASVTLFSVFRDLQAASQLPVKHCITGKTEMEHLFTDETEVFSGR
jgi:hypothetical protein